MAMYTIYNKHIYIKLRTKDRQPGRQQRHHIMFPPQVAITTTHGATSDDKSGQTDDP